MSASEAAAAIPPEDQAGGRSAVGAQDLAQGLMLVRASTINMVRLQLAMERRDRRVALQALDELTLLDRRIGDFIDDLPVDSDDVWADARRLEHQHRALAAEKLVLAAGTSGPGVTAISNQWIDQPQAAPAVDTRHAAAEEIPAEPRARDVSPHLIAAVLLLLMLAGAAAFLFLTDTGQALIASPAPIEGAS
jgi:hypothetical protein